jgi:hypothetical protein
MVLQKETECSVCDFSTRVTFYELSRVKLGVGLCSVIVSQTQFSFVCPLPLDEMCLMPTYCSTLHCQRNVTFDLFRYMCRYDEKFFLVSSSEKFGVTSTHKVKRVLYMYFPEN